MNERIFKNVKRILAGFGACLLSFSFLFVPVLAYGSNVEPLIAEIPVNNLVSVSESGPYNSNTYYRYRVVSGTGSASTPTLQSSNLLGVNVSLLYYYPSSSSTTRHLLAFFENDSIQVSGDYHVQLCLDSSSDQLIWTQRAYINVNQSYQFNDSGVTGTQLTYCTNSATGSGHWAYAKFSISKVSPSLSIPVIEYHSSITYPDSILAVISSNSSYWPWNFSTSSGGRHWSDGTSLDAENTSRYSQIFIVMDSNDDNSVTQEEVNYYNYTYNTNYDYSQVNQNQNFDEDEFLYYIATEINNGNDNPGGGTGSGGGSGSVGGGVTVTDSFTQSQTQSIAENAVNVSVTNNNSFDPENVNNLNSLINNNIGNQEGTNAITEAVYNINLMTGLARKISSLIGIILGFLPWWASTIVGIMFSILAVMVVFRLIHLFI